jgi:hypothetical protein
MLKLAMTVTGGNKEWCPEPLTHSKIKPIHIRGLFKQVLIYTPKYTPCLLLYYTDLEKKGGLISLKV